MCIIIAPTCWPLSLEFRIHNFVVDKLPNEWVKKTSKREGWVSFWQLTNILLAINPGNDALPFQSWVPWLVFVEASCSLSFSPFVIQGHQSYLLQPSRLSESSPLLWSKSRFIKKCLKMMKTAIFI